MTTLRATCPANNPLTQAILRHSLAIAALCKLIARKSRVGSADDLEFLGLVHDIGMVVLATNVEAEYRDLFQRAHAEKLALDELEKTEFGFSHDQIAVRVLHEFRLPKHHEAVLTHFHQTPDANETDEAPIKERAVLVLVHQLLAQVRSNEFFDETLFESGEDLATTLKLDEAAQAIIVEQALAHSSDFAG